MSHLAQDIRFAIRTLAKSPMFVMVALLSLALGIGANTAIFTLIDQVLLRLLPVKNPQQLVLLKGAGQHYGSNNGPNKLSYPMYADIRDQNKVFSGMFCSWDPSILKAKRSGSQASWYRGTTSRCWAWARRSDDQMQGGHPLAVLYK